MSQKNIWLKNHLYGNNNHQKKWKQGPPAIFPKGKKQGQSPHLQGVVKNILDDRVEKLLRCISQEVGWKHCVDSVLKFLKHCTSRYKLSLDIQASSDECSPTFKKYFTSNFSSLAKELVTCIGTFFDHLPADTLGKNFDKDDVCEKFGK